jgi:hypothetical protein
MGDSERKPTKEPAGRSRVLTTTVRAPPAAFVAVTSRVEE